MSKEPSGKWIDHPKWDPRWEPVATRHYTPDDLGGMAHVHNSLLYEAVVLANRLGKDDGLRIDRVEIGYRANVREPIDVTFYRWVK